MNTSEPIHGATALPDWGVIRAQGADAAAFLNGQLTNDIATLGDAHARLASYCSPKGRMLASFIAWKDGEDILLACRSDVLQAMLKRLSMFVLRAKCKLSDASTEVPLVGLAGVSALDFLGESAPRDTWGRAEHGGAALIRLPDAAGVARFVLAGESAPRDAAGVPALAAETWRWLEVQSGVASIEAATADQFVPQMINFELVGGVNFQKGCFPGQEIIARSQYRGTIKRRAFLFDTDAAARPGQEVFHSEDPGQPAGLVANAAPNPHGGSSALVEVKLAALGTGSLHLGSPDGPLLRRAALPYAVPADADTAA